MQGRLQFPKLIMILTAITLAVCIQWLRSTQSDKKNLETRLDAEWSKSEVLYSERKIMKNELEKANQAFSNIVEENKHLKYLLRQQSLAFRLLVQKNDYRSGQKMLSKMAAYDSLTNIKKQLYIASYKNHKLEKQIVELLDNYNSLYKENDSLKQRAFYVDGSSN